jgi:histidine phosphotransfer protein HptB
MKPLYSNLGGDPDLSDLVELFVDEMAGRVANILELLNRQDWDELRRMAHQLKGAAGSYGFDEISPCAGHLENTIRNSEPEENIRQATDDLVSICNRVCAGTPPEE